MLLKKLIFSLFFYTFSSLICPASEIYIGRAVQRNMQPPAGDILLNSSFTLVSNIDPTTASPTLIQTDQQIITGDSPLYHIPDYALFCLLINNLDYSLSQFDQFIQNIQGTVSLSIGIRTQLAGIFANPSLNGISTSAPFCIFAIQENSSKTQGSGFAIFAIVPVTDFGAAMSSIANTVTPDKSGVFEVATQFGSTLIAPVPGYALIGNAGNRELFALAQKSFLLEDGKKLIRGLSPDQITQSKMNAFWFYANIEPTRQLMSNPQTISKLNLFLSTLKTQYGAITIDSLEIPEGLNWVSLSLQPTYDLLNISLALNYHPGTAAENFVHKAPGSLVEKLRALKRPEETDLLRLMPDAQSADFSGTLSLADILYGNSTDELTKNQTFFAFTANTYSDQTAIRFVLPKEHLIEFFKIRAAVKQMRNSNN